MGKNSGIEWTNHTVNLWIGCTKVHEGCDHCYAEVFSNRWGYNVWGNDVGRRPVKGSWDNLLSMQKAAKKSGEIHRVFVGSLMDIFEKPMPLINADGVFGSLRSKSATTTTPVIGEGGIELGTHHLRFELFQNISDGLYPNLMFLFLTKRPSNINKYIPESWKGSPPENVMFGTSPVNQITFDKLVGQLLGVKGKRFLSVEPQLDGIKLGNIAGIDWIIQGGESGPRRRPFNLDWARSMRDQCKWLSIPYFFKQIDKVEPIPNDLQIHEFPEF